MLGCTSGDKTASVALTLWGEGKKMMGGGQQEAGSLLSSVGVGPCGSQNLPLGQVQRGALPVYGGGQEARTLPGGSVLQEAERVRLSLLGIAGGVTDKWTSGGGGSNVKSNLLQLFDGTTSTTSGKVAVPGAPSYQCASRTNVMGGGSVGEHVAP